MDLQTAHTLVLETLQKATSQNPDVLKPAEQKLREWEIQPGFYSILFNIISNHSLDVNVRWMAVLYFKNGVDRYWRKNAPNAISKDEKISLRRGLIENFREPVNQIALQLAVLISKVARFDCPREWPELIPTLLSNVETNDAFTQHRALLVLHQVIKALASKRLMYDQNIFCELTSNIYTFILNLWNNYTEQFIQLIHRNAAVELIVEQLEKALLTLRILRKLTVHGFKKLHESHDAVIFINSIFERAKMTLECRKQLRGKGIYLLELCEKFIIHLTKILAGILEFHPKSYVDFIALTLEFTTYYLFTDEGAHLLYERFIIQCFNLIKAILLCTEYKQSSMNQDAKIQRAYDIKIAFFQPNKLTEMCRKLVSHYFILTQDDLHMWDTDPETFAIDEVGASWKYSLRPSIETVFVTLVHEFRDILVPVLADIINSSHRMVAPTDLQGILQKDAIYNAAGLTAFDLFSEIDFNEWFQTTLLQELKVKDNNYRIIRRRVTWLIGIWLSIKLYTELRPVLYDILLVLLQPNEDMAVRLAASTALRCAVDDFEFNSDQFLKYLEPSFSLLFSLLKEAHECDTKMHVLNVLSLIVERMGNSIRPYVDSLIQYLPMLWVESEEHNMLRCAIVATLGHLVNALGVHLVNAGNTIDLGDFLLNVIRLGTDTNQSAIVYLLEDCLELWLAVLENSTQITDQLMQLFNNMPTLIENSTENLRMCLSIVQAYTLLTPERILMIHGPVLVTLFDSILADLRVDGIKIVMRTVEMFLRTSPKIAVDIIKPLIPRILDDVCHQDAMVVLTPYFCVLSRVLLISPEILSLSLSALNEPPDQILQQILRIWTYKMPLVGQIEQRKLLALALSTLLTAQSTPVLEQFPVIVTNIIEALNDVLVVDDMGVAVDSIMINFNSSPHHSSSSTSFNQDDVDYETEHNQRYKQLASIDPVYTIVLKDFFQLQMGKLREQIGATHFDQLISRIDDCTLTQLKHMIGI